MKRKLEEVAENESEYLADWEDKRMYKRGFKDGFKIAQEQDKNKYSEEEVLEILGSYAEWSINGDCTYYEWFEQFKKK